MRKNNNNKTPPKSEDFVCLDEQIEKRSSLEHRIVSSAAVKNGNGRTGKIRSILVIYQTRKIIAESSDYCNITV